jgi:hypothetical protein
MLFVGLKSRANLEHDTDRFEQRRFVALQTFFAERKISSFNSIKFDRPTIRCSGFSTCLLDCAAILFQRQACVDDANRERFLC